MLEIRPISNKHEQEALAARCRVSFDKDCFAYAAVRGEEPVAIGQFRCDPKSPPNKQGSAFLHSIGHIPPGDEETDRLLLVGILAFCTENACTRFAFSKAIPAHLPQSLGLHCDPNRAFWFW